MDGNNNMNESNLNNTNNVSAGVIVSLIGSWLMLIFFFWTIILLIIPIINIVFLNQIKKGNNEHYIAASVLSILFGGILGIVGGILMLVDNNKTNNY